MEAQQNCLLDVFDHVQKLKLPDFHIIELLKSQSLPLPVLDDPQSDLWPVNLFIAFDHTDWVVVKQSFDVHIILADADEDIHFITDITKSCQRIGAKIFDYSFELFDALIELKSP